MTYRPVKIDDEIGQVRVTSVLGQVSSERYDSRVGSTIHVSAVDGSGRVHLLHHVDEDAVNYEVRSSDTERVQASLDPDEWEPCLCLERAA